MRFESFKAPWSTPSLTRASNSRQQLKTLPVRTPTWLKLYEVLVDLEKEINETLPEFQELAVMLS